MYSLFDMKQTNYTNSIFSCSSILSGNHLSDNENFRDLGFPLREKCICPKQGESIESQPKKGTRTL